MEESSIFISCIDADNSEQVLSMYGSKAQEESNLQNADDGQSVFSDGPAAVDSTAPPSVTTNSARDGKCITSLEDPLPTNVSEIQGVMFTQLFHSDEQPDGPALVAAEASTATHPANVAPEDINPPDALKQSSRSGDAARSSPTRADIGATSAASKRRASVVGASTKPPATSPVSSTTAAYSRRATVAGSMGSWGRPASPGASNAAARRSSVAGGSAPSYMRPTAPVKDKAKASEAAATTSRPNSRMSRSPSSATAAPGASPPSTMAGEMEEYRKLLVLEGDESKKVGPATSNYSPKGAIPSTEPSPFRLTTHIRAEWEDRLTPESAKLTTEEKQLRQAEKEQEALRARIADSGDSFRRAQEAPSKQAPPPQAPATELQPFDLISAERHVEYRHAWALKVQQAEEKSIKASIFKAQDFDESIKAGMYAHVTPRLAYVTESRAPAFMSDARAAKHAEADAQKRAFQEALEQAQEADRIAKLSPREREQEELHKRHMTKARPLPAFYKDRSAKGGSPARAEQAHDTNPFAGPNAEAKPSSSAEAEGVVELHALDSVEPIVDDPFLNVATQAATDVGPVHAAEQACSAKEEGSAVEEAPALAADQPAPVTAALNEAAIGSPAEIKVVEDETTAAADSKAVVEAKMMPATVVEVGATVQPISGPQVTASPDKAGTKSRAWPARLARAMQAMRRMFVACSASHGALE